MFTQEKKINNRAYYPNFENAYQSDYPYCAKQAYYGYNYPYGAQQNYAPTQYPYYAADNRDYKFYDNDAEYVLEYYNAEKVKYDISVVGHELRLRCKEDAKNHPERYWSYYLPEDIDYSKMKATYKENALYVYFAKRADIVKTIYSIKAS